MPSAYWILEVVQVIGDCRLVDSESYERVYWRRDGLPLARGYYVVSWPQSVSPKRFNEDASFRGPFQRRDDAQAALDQLAARAEAWHPGAARRPDASSSGGSTGTVLHE